LIFSHLQGRRLISELATYALSERQQLARGFDFPRPSSYTNLTLIVLAIGSDFSFLASQKRRLAAGDTQRGSIAPYVSEIRH